jgi:hypothetical protein
MIGLIDKLLNDRMQASSQDIKNMKKAVAGALKYPVKTLP